MEEFQKEIKQVEGIQFFSSSQNSWMQIYKELNRLTFGEIIVFGTDLWRHFPQLLKIWRLLIHTKVFKIVFMDTIIIW